MATTIAAIRADEDDARADMTALSRSERVVMLSGGILVALAMSGITPVLPRIEEALAHNANEALMVKLLVSVVGMSMVVGAPLTGFLVRRVGARRILIANLLVYVVAGTAGLYLNDLLSLLVSRMLLGVAAAGAVTVGMTLINTRLAPGQRGRWMGLHVSVAIFGSLLLQPILGHLGEAGWRYPFAVYALPLPLVVLLLAGRSESSTSEEPLRPDVREKPLTSWFPFRFLPLAVAIGSITYLPMVYLPFLMRENGVGSPSSIAYVLLADTVLSAIFAFLFGRTQRLLSPRTMFVISFGLTAAGMAIAALAPNVLTVIIGMMVFGVGIGWFVPNLMTAVAREVALAQQARTVGLVKAAHYAAAPLCVLAAEPLTRVVGPSGAMGLAAALAAVCCLLFILAPSSRAIDGVA